MSSIDTEESVGLLTEETIPVEPMSCNFVSYNKQCQMKGEKVCSICKSGFCTYHFIKFMCTSCLKEKIKKTHN